MAVGGGRTPVWVQVPRAAAALLNRILALPAGIHTLTLVKVEGGAGGLVGWTVVEGKLEQPSGCSEAV